GTEPLGDGDTVGDLLDDRDRRGQSVIRRGHDQATRPSDLVVECIVVLGRTGRPAATVDVEHHTADRPIGHEGVESNLTARYGTKRSFGGNTTSAGLLAVRRRSISRPSTVRGSGWGIWARSALTWRWASRTSSATSPTSWLVAWNEGIGAPFGGRAHRRTGAWPNHLVS